MKNSRPGLPAVILIFAAFLLSGAAAWLASVPAVQHRNAETAVALAAAAYDEIKDALDRPIDAAETMAADESFSRDVRDGDTERIVSRLRGVQKHFGYANSFYVDDATGRYFTHNGLDHVISESMPEAAWFYAFRESGDDLLLNIAVNREENFIVTIFANKALRDAEGRFLGVCGVSVDMNGVHGLLGRYEREHGVSVTLSGSHGAGNPDAEVDAPAIRTGSVRSLTGVSFAFREHEDGSFTVWREIEKTGWKLVLKGKPHGSELTRLFIRNELIALGILLIAVLAALFIPGRKPRDAQG
ncbi:MAG: PDC sensor domain-containing protein [Mailhella sp.]|nr:PDC sensor domain-containing protein [Mailhella sp.]